MTAPTPPPTARRGSDARLLRGYGPLLGIIVSFLMMSLLAPTVAPEERVTANSPITGPGGSHTAGTATTVAGAGPIASGGTAGTEGTAGAVGTPAGGAVACEGSQIQNDPYSPPCFMWEGGDNGGATARGVTADSINVVLRDPGPPYDVGSVVGQLTGKDASGGATTTREDFIRTYETLITYFNRSFQLYGREMKLQVFEGQGSLFDEILGGGQSTANADAITAAQEVQAFADISPEPPVYADALQKQGVISTNPIYPNRQWFADRSPYTFGLLPDCTKVIDFIVEFALKSLKDKPVLAGEYKGQPRKIGLVYPQAPIYQECGDQARQQLEAGGLPIADYKLYTLSLEGIPNEAGPIASQFANQGITTVLLGTDPLMPYFMTTNATQSEWFPEWINVGIAFMDTDWAGQLYDSAQWKNAYGISLTGAHQPARSTYGYAAYQSIDPNTSPDPLLVEAIYYQLYILAVGIHMAGPELTPETFADGMHRYQAPAVGPQGTWAFPPGDFTAPQDGRIIWWDPNMTSVYNGASGAWRDTGERFRLGTLPSGDPPVSLTP